MADTPGKTGQKKKASTVRHTRAIQRDRSKRPTVTPPVGEIEARLSEVIHPATYAQIAAYHADGLEPVMHFEPGMLRSGHEQKSVCQ